MQASLMLLAIMTSGALALNAAVDADVQAETSAATQSATTVDRTDLLSTSALVDAQTAVRADVCHKGDGSLTVGLPALWAHLMHHDTIGDCK